VINEAPPNNTAPTTDQAPAATRTPPAASNPSAELKTSPIPSPKVLAGPGLYAFTYEGAVGTVQVPANIKDPRLEKYGDYRRLANARPITYLIAQVDNRSNDVITMYEVVVVTDSGQQIEATSISNYVDMWQDAFVGDASGSSGDLDKYNAGTALSAASNFYLHPGAKGTAILGAKEAIRSVKRVFVYPAGPFDRVEAHRIK